MSPHSVLPPISVLWRGLLLLLRRRSICKDLGGHLERAKDVLDPRLVDDSPYVTYGMWEFLSKLGIKVDNERSRDGARDDEVSEGQALADEEGLVGKMRVERPVCANGAVVDILVDLNV